MKVSGFFTVGSSGKWLPTIIVILIGCTCCVLLSASWVSDSFTTLLDVELALLAAKWSWVRILLVGMDSAVYVDIAKGLSCRSFERGNASDFKMFLKFTRLEGHDETESMQSPCLIISTRASCSQGRGAEHQGFS